MRFIEGGPSIPDELLMARDEGRVVFFCGAGVSREKAELPDFFGLARKVASTLGVSEERPAQKLIMASREIEDKVGLPGVVSADRVFGLLERDFESDTLQVAVAKALKPKPKPDLSAHQTLLNLATTPDGKVRLVTTNFDRLFDDCQRATRSWQYPLLPDPSRPGDLDGIVYLHGRATPKYDGAEGDGFVLSSSEFGRAYLAEGWATSFIRSIIDNFYVVFVGYQADDPPVQYLLEALNKSAGQLEGVYAFQSGNHNDAVGRWHHKGVEAIAYDVHGNSHETLWGSLAAWAERAKDIDGWYQNRLHSALKGPEKMLPHERGQIAHIVSTTEGARRFSTFPTPLPPAWLCVFDSSRRYATPGRLGSLSQLGPYFDPFDHYGLDSDRVPQKSAQDDLHPQRDIPSEAWDAFQILRRDQQNFSSDTLSGVRGFWAANSPRLVPRLRILGDWIQRVSCHPATIWWASLQTALHPDLQNAIHMEIERGDENVPAEARAAWMLLFEYYEEAKRDFNRDWYGLQNLVERVGWSPVVLRRYQELKKPRLKTGGYPSRELRPPKRVAKKNYKRLIQLDVDYPEFHGNGTDIPDKWLNPVVRVLRKNLELAIELEGECGPFGLSYVVPIIPQDDDPNIDHHERTFGISGLMLQYVHLFNRLRALNSRAAQTEMMAWPDSEDSIFSRLRIWAAGVSDLTDTDASKKILRDLSNSVFWDSRHQRDLLLSIKQRWLDMGNASQKRIEGRLLKGPSKWRREDSKQYTRRKASAILERIIWLSEQGCSFSFDLDAKIEDLMPLAPKWQKKYAAQAADSMEGRGGTVETLKEHKNLLDIPLIDVLPTANKSSGRSENFLETRDPFLGLSEERPVRAFKTLVLAASKGEYPEWAWETFLRKELREKDPDRRTKQIAHRLSRLPVEALATLSRSVAEWLNSKSKALASADVGLFDELVDSLIEALADKPLDGRSSIVRGSREPDWVMEAINAPAGRLTESLFGDPRKDNLEEGGGYPKAWLNHVENLLALPGDLRRHALVILCRNLRWFYYVDPVWTGRFLIPALTGDDLLDRQAALSGFLWSARVPVEDLYMTLKPLLMEAARQPRLENRSHREALAALLLLGWDNKSQATRSQYISDEEFRQLLVEADDDFRSEVIWLLGRWSKSKGIKTKWRKNTSRFLSEVWPRQISTKTPIVSARLCELVLSDEKRFPALFRVVLPLLTTIESNQLHLPIYRSSEETISDKHPQLMLELLDTVLPDNVASWPYGTNTALQGIVKSAPSLQNDAKYLRLKRLLDSR